MRDRGKPSVWSEDKEAQFDAPSLGPGPHSAPFPTTSGRSALSRPRSAFHNDELDGEPAARRPTFPSTSHPTRVLQLPPLARIVIDSSTRVARLG